MSAAPHISNDVPQTDPIAGPIRDPLEIQHDDHAWVGYEAAFPYMGAGGGDMPLLDVR